MKAVTTGKLARSLSTAPQAGRLTAARAELHALNAPPNRADLLAIFDAALARAGKRFEMRMRRALEQIRLSDQRAQIPTQVADEDAAVLNLVFDGFSKAPSDVIACLLAPQLVANVRAMIGRIDYAGDDSPPLSERSARRAALLQEIARLERTGPRQ
jgi:hypothetical protein